MEIGVLKSGLDASTAWLDWLISSSFVEALTASCVAFMETFSAEEFSNFEFSM
jgi:hypothetical protein